MKIGAFDEVNTSINGSHSKDERFLGIFSRIDIYNPQNRTDVIYGTVIHELAHSAHWDLSHNSFPDTDSKVKESWARGVEWELSRMVYTRYQCDYNRLKYTGVIEDMIDGKKTRVSSYYWTENNPWVILSKEYKDEVENYTIKQLEDALVGQKTWNGWENNIINKYNNETEKKLHETFTFWNTL